MEQMSDQQRMEFFCTGESKGLSNEELKNAVIRLLKESRVQHVLGCAQTAVRLAQLWGANQTDAYRAGLLHDVTKALDGQLQKQLSQQLQIPVESFYMDNPKTLHQITGAAVAERVFGENADVCLAIRSHTTGCADMNTLQKIIYVADYVEPNREFDGIDTLRHLAETDLDGALKMGLEMTANLLSQKGNQVCPASLDALNDLKKERTEC